MEVLFTFLAERYERKSVLITSNLVFSEWNRIFKDPMTTAAAIDCHRRSPRVPVSPESPGPGLRPTLSSRALGASSPRARAPRFSRA